MLREWGKTRTDLLTIQENPAPVIAESPVAAAPAQAEIAAQ